MILERKLSVIGNIWYSPCGFVCDYQNEELVSSFSNYMHSCMKKEKVGFYIIDPKVIWKKNGEYTNESEPITNILNRSGYQYNVNRNQFTYQPPLTVGISLLDESNKLYNAQDLLKKYDKGVRYSIKISQKRCLEDEKYKYSDLKNNPSLYDDFLSVMNDTSQRVGFIERKREYYLSFMKELSKWATMDLIYYDFSKDKMNNEVHLKKLDALEKSEAASEKTKQEIKSLQSLIESFQQREKLVQAEKKEKICVAAGITIRFGKEANCLFGGTRNLLRNYLRSSHFLNHIRIQDSIESGMIFHDLGDVTYDYLNPNSNLYGLYQFKKSFAADTIEYIGEYFLIENKWKYYFYTKCMPLAKKGLYQLRKCMNRK